MAETIDTADVASALRVSIGLLVRRLRQVRGDSELTLPETSALARLDRAGPTTASALAKTKQISPQSMGATLGALEARGYVDRAHDPDDGRRAVLTISPAGLEVLRSRRDARLQQMAQALATDFTPAELKALSDVAPLLERLGHRGW